MEENEYDLPIVVRVHAKPAAVKLRLSDFLNRRDDLEAFFFFNTMYILVAVCLEMQQNGCTLEPPMYRFQ